MALSWLLGAVLVLVQPSSANPDRLIRAQLDRKAQVKRQQQSSQGLHTEIAECNFPDCYRYYNDHTRP